VGSTYVQTEIHMHRSYMHKDRYHSLPISTILLKASALTYRLFMQLQIAYE